MARVGEKLGSHSDTEGIDQNTPKAKFVMPPNEKESASDAGHGKSGSRRSSSNPPPTVQRQSSALSSKQAKAKQDNSAQNMTVETETVTSIPQVALATGTKAESANGTLKTKPSTETIKPKKDKKKPARKQPAVSSGNGKQPFFTRPFIAIVK